MLIDHEIAKVDGLVGLRLGIVVDIFTPAAAADRNGLRCCCRNHPGDGAQCRQVITVQLALIHIGIKQIGDEERGIGFVQPRGPGDVGRTLLDDKGCVGDDGQRQGYLQGNQQSAELVTGQCTKNGSDVFHGFFLTGS